MQYVIQLNCPVSSLEEAQRIADGLRQQEGCIDARYTRWSVTAHFAVDHDIPLEALPEGCRLVPASALEFLQRINNMYTARSTLP